MRRVPGRRFPSFFPARKQANEWNFLRSLALIFDGISRFVASILTNRNLLAIMRDSFGQLAQLVEQRIENPRVRGSIPRLATNT